MSPTAGDFLNAARAYLGDVEQPRGSNNVPGITDWYGFPGPWCFPAGTLVLTPDGLRAIETIVPGEHVVSHLGHHQPVLATGNRMAPVLSLHAYGVPNIIATPEHPFLARRRSHSTRRRVLGEPEWIAAQELQRGDMIAAVIPPAGEVAFDEAMAYVLGMYVADGWRVHRSKNEVYIHDDWPEAERIEKALRLAGLHVREDRRRTGVQFTVRDAAFYELCGLFGDLAPNKRIGPALTWDRPAREAFLKGYLDGDGCEHQTVRRRSCNTTSRELALGVSLLLRASGIACRLSEDHKLSDTTTIEGRTVHQRLTFWAVEWVPNPRQTFTEWGDGVLWSPLRSVRPRDEQRLVYNLTVGEDQSFVADGAVVHNCDMLVSKAADDCGLPHQKSAWVGNEADMAAAGIDGYSVVAPEDLQAGDWICHDFPGGVKLDHIDIVEVRNGDTLYCIDGNWGDACVRVIRHVGDWSIQNGAVIRPPYASAPTPQPQPDPGPGNAGTTNPYLPLDVDGAFGAQTCAALQWSLNDSHVADMNGVTPIDVDGGFGPSTASSLQRYLGVGVDGQFGPVSTRALQAHVGAGVDGAWGADTTSHLQSALNAATF